MAPWFSVPNVSKPYSISNDISLLAPSNSVLTNFLMDKTEEPENDTIVSRMSFR